MAECKVEGWDKLRDMFDSALEQATREQRDKLLAEILNRPSGVTEALVAYHYDVRPSSLAIPVPQEQNGYAQVTGAGFAWGGRIQFDSSKGTRFNHCLPPTHVFAPGADTCCCGAVKDDA